MDMQQRSSDMQHGNAAPFSFYLTRLMGRAGSNGACRVYWNSPSDRLALHAATVRAAGNRPRRHGGGPGGVRAFRGRPQHSEPSPVNSILEAKMFLFGSTCGAKYLKVRSPTTPVVASFGSSLKPTVAYIPVIHIHHAGYVGLVA